MNRRLQVGDLFRCAALAERITGVTPDADPTRGQAVFRVIAAEMSGGGRGHSLGDIYPDGWHVTAERLGVVDETVRFYQSGCFVGSLLPALIEQVDDVSTRPVNAPLASNAERRTWAEFREAGMLTVANTVLHWFGWQVTLSIDDDGAVVDVYPERTKYRGFQPDLYANGMKRLTSWIVAAAPALQQDIDDV